MSKMPGRTVVSVWSRGVTRTLAMMILAVMLAACGETITPELVVDAAGVQPPPQESVGAATETVDDAATASEELAAEVEAAADLLYGHQGDPADLEEARKILVSVLARDREFAPAYAMLAVLEYKSGGLSGDVYPRTRVINASKFARRALELDPDLPEAHHIFARIHFYLQEYGEAEEAIDRADELGVERDSVNAMRALLAGATGDEREALRFAREVIADENARLPTRIEMLMFAALRLGRAGFRADAEEMWKRVIELDPDMAWGHGNYAGFLLSHGEVDRAMVHAERAVEIMHYPAGFEVLAAAYLAKADQLHEAGQYSEAGRTVEKLSQKLIEDDPDILTAIGDYYYRIFIRTSDPDYIDRAVTAYESVLAIDPGRESVARVLDRIRERHTG